MSFPSGPVGSCHPLNLRNFDLGADCLPVWGQVTGLPVQEWEPRISALHRFAVLVRNCSTVQQCSLGMLFLHTSSIVMPGFDATAKFDYWRVLYWTQLQKRLRRIQRRHLLRRKLPLSKVSVAEHGRKVSPPCPEEVTIGIHADPKSAKGPWRGQLNAWEAFAETQRHRFLLDLKPHFTGKVFARYLGLYWASSSKHDNGFWSAYSWPRPHRVSLLVPGGSFLEAKLDTQLLEKLRIFNQPPAYWDSLEALAASVPLSPWTVWIDFDLTISPCCFDSFSFVHLIGRTRDGGLPHVVIRDSPHEDYHHHCANAGFLIVRNSSVGRFFVELARERRSWPAIPYGYQSAFAESLLELLGLEAEIYGETSRSYRSQCLHHLTLGRAMGDQSYANYCLCWRAQLDRLVGLQRDQSRWVQFLRPREGPEMGFLLASTFLYRHTLEGRYRGAGFLPLGTWTLEEHLSFVDRWMPAAPGFGGACGLLPLVLHWASLPYRPALIHDFLAHRFPSLLQELLRNGSVAALKQGFLWAAAEGRRQWQQWRRQHGETLPVDWQMPNSSLEAAVQKKLEEAGCTIGSHRLWLLGGWINE